MKHIRKIMSALLVLTLVLTSNIIPVMACSLEGVKDYHEPDGWNEYGVWELDKNAPLDENGNPIVVPCEKVDTQGYCDIPTVTGLIDYYPENAPGETTNLHFYYVENPYYKEVATTDTGNHHYGSGSATQGSTEVDDLVIEEEPALNPDWYDTDVTVTEIVPCKYDRVENFSEGLAAVKLDGKWGFIDTTGKEVVPCKYESASDFSDGLAAVELDGKWGYIDKTGKEVVPCNYNEAWNFYEGMAAVKLDGKWGFIAVNGDTVPGPAVKTAAENIQTVKVDGKDISFAMYSPDNGGTNYVRLVDLAVALNGTKGQYNVGWDSEEEQVNLTSHTAYSGATSAAPFHTPMEYTTLTDPTYVDGVPQNLEALRFEYQNGGYTYYKLRDLGRALGFNVGWDNATQRIYIESDKPYDPNN